MHNKSFDTASHIKDYTIDVYEKNAQCRFFFILYFLPDGNKKNKKKSHEYLEATTDVACRDLTLEPWGPPGLGTWKTGGSL